jgi:hypothetical protein
LILVIKLKLEQKIMLTKLVNVSITIYYVIRTKLSTSQFPFIIIVIESNDIVSIIAISILSRVRVYDQ